MAVEAHDKIGVGATDADVRVLVVLLDFFMAFFGVIEHLPDDMGQLRGLVAVGHDLVAAYTQPPRPAGR